MLKVTFSGCVLMWLCLIGARADADTIMPGDLLRIEFTTPESPGCLDGPCDTLVFDLPFTSNPGTPTAATLFDGSQLLGIFQTDVRCLTNGTCAALSPSFVAAGSAYGLNSPVIDFGSIVAGTIRGRLDFAVSAPTGFDVAAPGEVSIGRASQTGNSSGYLGTITSQALIPSEAAVPEPGSLLLLSSGITLLVFRRHGKPRN